MVVRAKTGRKRYIAFEILPAGEHISRNRLARIIEMKCSEAGMKSRLDLILVEGSYGIARTTQRGLEEAKEFLNSLPVDDSTIRLRTVRTSGTIRTLKESYINPNARSRSGLA